MFVKFCRLNIKMCYAWENNICFFGYVLGIIVRVFILFFDDGVVVSLSVGL